MIVKVAMSTQFFFYSENFLSHEIVRSHSERGFQKSRFSDVSSVVDTAVQNI